MGAKRGGPSVKNDYNCEDDDSKLWALGVDLERQDTKYVSPTGNGRPSNSQTCIQPPILVTIVYSWAFAARYLCI